jgi:flavorubredoxin
MRISDRVRHIALRWKFRYIIGKKATGERNMKVLKRILAGLGIFVGVVILSAVAAMLAISSTNASKGNHEEILKSAQDEPKRALVVYQPSVSDVSSGVAHRIARGLNDGGYEVTLNNPGDFLPDDLSQYDVVVFGSPVYMGKVSDALTGYMKRITALPAGRIVLYSTGSVMEVTGELDAMESLLSGTTAYKKVKFDAKIPGSNDSLAYDLGSELAK